MCGFSAIAIVTLSGCSRLENIENTDVVSQGWHNYLKESTKLLKFLRPTWF